MFFLIQEIYLLVNNLPIHKLTDYFFIHPKATGIQQLVDDSLNNQKSEIVLTQFIESMNQGLVKIVLKLLEKVQQKHIALLLLHRYH